MAAATAPAPDAETTTEETVITEQQATDTQNAEETPEPTPEQKEESRQAFAARKAKEQLAALQQEVAAYKRRDDEAKATAEEARKAQLTEEQRIREERDIFKAKAEAFEMDNLRERIGREFNLRDEMIPRLIGTDETALRADAADLVQKGFTKARPRVGTTTAPAGEQGVAGRQYKRSELRNLAFFNANRADIMLAQAEGRIISD